MNKQVNIVLVGASGRMGREICRIAEGPGHSSRIRITGGIVRETSEHFGKTIPGIGSPLSAAWTDAMSGAHVIVDYSSDGGAKTALRLAATQRIPALIASTGISEETQGMVSEVSRLVPVVFTANTSVVVTVMRSLARQAARMLGNGYDVELVEMHHRYKKDAPSGTALMLLEEVAKAQDKRLGDVLDCGRKGEQALRKAGSYGAQAVRGGDVAGEHMLYFFGEGERLEITQRATSRSVFAEGALRAVYWLAAQARRGPGCFSMEDVLQDRE